MKKGTSVSDYFVSAVVGMLGVVGAVEGRDSLATLEILRSQIVSSKIDNMVVSEGKVANLGLDASAGGPR
jgi:hypothetical protein